MIYITWSLSSEGPRRCFSTRECATLIPLNLPAKHQLPWQTVESLKSVLRSVGCNAVNTVHYLWFAAWDLNKYFNSSCTAPSHDCHFIFKSCRGDVRHCGLQPFRAAHLILVHIMKCSSHQQQCITVYYNISILPFMCLVHYQLTFL